MELKEARTCVIWPHEGNKGTVLLKPHASPENDSGCRNWAQWKKKSEEKLSEYVQRFQSEVLQVESKLWVNVTDEIQNVEIDGARIVHQPENGSLILVGQLQHVSNAKQIITEIIRQEQVKAEREAQCTQQTMKLTQEKLQRFLICGIKDEVQSQFPAVEIQLSVDANELGFEGIPTEIQQARLSAYEMLDQLLCRSIPLSSNMYRFVSNNKDKIHEIFGMQGYKASCELGEANKIQLYGRTEGDVRNAESFFQDQIISSTLSTKSAAAMDLLQSQKGLNQMKMITASSHATVNFNKSRRVVDITGFKDNVDDALLKMGKFIEENAVHEKIIRLPKGHVKYLGQFCEKELENLRQKNESNALKIDSRVTKKNGEFIVSGNEKGVQNAIEGIQSLSTNLVQQKHRVDKAGMPKLLREDKGRRNVKAIAHECSCVIDIEISDEAAKEEDNTTSHKSTVAAGSQRLCNYTSLNGRHFAVYKGDLTKEKVDVIVNAANTNLRHSGGIAGAIVAAGGNVIQQESDAIIRQKGKPLDIAEAVCTGAGTLPYRHVIHVAGPIWPRNQPGTSQGSPRTTEEKLLYKAVTSALQEAQAKGLRSIAIPAISSGVFGFPINLCATTLVDATADFFDSNVDSSLQEIRFTCIESPKCNALKEAMKRKFGDDVKDDPNSDVAGSVGVSARPRDIVKVPKVNDTSKSHKTSTGSQLKRSFTNKPSSTIVTSEGIQIVLKIGSIADDKVDVIVNPVGSDVDLSRGNVSRALLLTAGQTLQQDCYTQLRLMGRLPPGEFIETSLGNLGCLKVYHVNCPQYKEGVSEQALHSVIDKMLTKAHQSGIRSIAIPAIGTGNLGFPADVTARIMYQQLFKFSQQFPATQLQEIHFWVYDTDFEIIQAFESEMQGFIDSSGAAKSLQSSTPRRLRKIKKATLNKPQEAHLPSDVDSTTSELKIGPIVVTIQQGDLTNETTDAIVNIVGKNLALDGAVSEALVRAGGATIKDECDKIRKSQVPDVVKTSSGNLPCKSVIHAYLAGSDKIKMRTRDILKLAEKEGLRSVAFPALGTGKIGGVPEQCASDLIEAIKEFVTKDKPRNLQLIRITIFQQDMVTPFEDAIKSKAAKPGRAIGLLAKGFSAMKNVLSFSAKEHEFITLEITSNDEGNVTKAINMIDGFVNDEHCSEVLNLESDVIGDMTDETFRKMCEIAQLNEINVKRCAEKTFLLEGLKASVKSAKADIQTLLRRIQEDKLLNNEAKWRYQTDQGNYDEYDEEVNALIERAHRDNKPSVEVPLTDGRVSINFKTMVESDLLGIRKDIKVHRSDLKAEQTSSIPNNWVPMFGGKNLAVVPLQPGTEEYKKVNRTFTLAYRRTTIVQIERIQNVELYKQYTARKENMQARLGRDPELSLYHGTSYDTVHKINSGGFNRSFCGKNAVKYGQGTYFAKEAAFSAENYSTPGPNGNKCIYLCKVLVGDYVQGDHRMIVPPRKTFSSSETYDSTVNSDRQPTIFVIYHDAQAYPEYLITFR